MVKSVWEYPINSTTNGSKLGNRRFFNANSKTKGNGKGLQQAHCTGIKNDTLKRLKLCVRTRGSISGKFKIQAKLCFFNNCLRACSHGGEMSRTPEISHPPEATCSGFTRNWVGYYPGAIRTRHNNIWENCILNVQDGVQQKPYFISFLDTFSHFAAVLYQLNGFLLAFCACPHLASAISAMLACMCEYWSCATQLKLSRPHEISRCRAFTRIIVDPS